VTLFECDSMGRRTKMTRHPGVVIPGSDLVFLFSRAKGGRDRSRCARVSRPRTSPDRRSPVPCGTKVSKQPPNSQTTCHSCSHPPPTRSPPSSHPTSAGTRPGSWSSEISTDGTLDFAYDVTSQLTGVSGRRNESYTYDPLGNRTMPGYQTGAGNRLLADLSAVPGTGRRQFRPHL